MQVICKKCDCQHIFVRWTRPTIRGITRGRECRNCGHQFQTREVIEKDSRNKDNVTDM